MEKIRLQDFINRHKNGRRGASDGFFSFWHSIGKSFSGNPNLRFTRWTIVFISREKKCESNARFKYSMATSLPWYSGYTFNHPECAGQNARSYSIGKMYKMSSERVFIMRTHITYFMRLYRNICNPYTMICVIILNPYKNCEIIKANNIFLN